MKTITSVLFALFAAFTVSSYAAGPLWPAEPWQKILSKKDAHSCCEAGGKVAIACKDCKTINETADKKTAGSFFDKDAKHNCSGCKGKVTVSHHGGGKGPVDVTVTHVCSKCAKDSAITCATHVKGAK